MNNDDFVQLVKVSSFLEEERQQELIDNAAWMTVDEKGFLAEQITQTGQKMEENAQGVLSELETLEKALQDFQHEEIPKFMKEEEQHEQEEEASKAEHLLDEIEEEYEQEEEAEKAQHLHDEL